MNNRSELLAKEYAAAIEDYLAGRGELALLRAYDAGRRALAQGLGVLEIVGVYQATVTSVSCAQPSDAAKERVLEWGPNGLAESLAPFEMVLRGAHEANARLQQSLNSLLFVEEQLRHQNGELVAAHQAVEKQRSRYQALFDFAPDGYLITGIEGAIREANTAAATLLRTPKELLPGQSLSEFVVKADRELFRNRLRELHQGLVERIENWQVQIEPRNGPPMPAVLTVVAERSAPATADLRWLLRDDTGRKRLEKERTLSVVGHARAQSARRFEFLAEASSLLVGSLDLEGSLVSIARLTAAFFGSWCFLNVIDADQSVRQLEVAHAGLSDADLAHDLGRHCLFGGPAADRPEAWFSGPQLIKPLNGRWCDQIADGPEHAVLLRRLRASCVLVLPLRIHNRLLGMLTLIAGPGARPYKDTSRALGEDLARRCALAIENARLYRDVVAERDKAARASQAKDQLVAILGHELRNPLTPIVGWARILQRHTKICADPLLAEGVQAMGRNVSTLSRLISDCLDMATISVGKIRLERKLVDLNKIILESVEAVHEMASARGLRLTTELAPVSVPVTGDPLRLQQLVMNLLGNAVKYTEREGSISVRSLCAADEAGIVVTDTGLGIAPPMLERIFEPFQQGADYEQTPRSGLGLGLAIARQIVEMHGGQIWAESRGRGYGSAFRVRLPRSISAEADRNVGAAAAPPSRAGTGVRVLVIEDSADIQFVLKVELEVRGHAVITAPDGHQGIEIAKEYRPDVIISDIKMPFMDGYQLIKAIRALPELSQTPVIALTGFGAKADVERALAAGFNACVCKPAEPEKLASVIDQLIAQKVTVASGAASGLP